MRVFTAVEISAEARADLHREARALLDGIGSVGIVAEENLHVTLKFVGDLRRDDLADLVATLAECTSGLPAGEVEIAGIGAFPGLARPRVLFAGVSDPSGILEPLHARLNRALARFGAKSEQKRYTPHVTLARVRGPVDTRELARRVESGGEFWFSVEPLDAITLFMSELSRGGPPQYTVLGRYDLGGPSEPGE
jgi:2'-5' RNA ligase